MHVSNLNSLLEFKVGCYGGSDNQTHRQADEQKRALLTVPDVELFSLRQTNLKLVGISFCWIFLAASLRITTFSARQTGGGNP